MAIYNAGYLSPIRKKLGNAVGRKWRTLDVLAVYQPFVRNPRTESQQLVRARFGAASKLAMVLAAALEYGFKAATDGTKVPPRSYFIKKNWSRVHADTPGSTTIDYEDLDISQGSLNPVAFGVVAYTNAQEITVPVNDDSQSSAVADPADKVYVVALNPSKSQAVMGDGVLRAAEDADLRVPANWVGDRVHVYGFAVGAGGLDEGKITNTTYLGSGTIV